MSLSRLLADFVKLAGESGWIAKTDFENGVVEPLPRKPCREFFREEGRRPLAWRIRKSRSEKDCKFKRDPDLTFVAHLARARAGSLQAARSRIGRCGRWRCEVRGHCQRWPDLRSAEIAFSVCITRPPRAARSAHLRRRYAQL